MVFPGSSIRRKADDFSDFSVPAQLNLKAI
jgi:hypothetical protein